MGTPKLDLHETASKGKAHDSSVQTLLVVGAEVAASGQPGENIYGVIYAVLIIAESRPEANSRQRILDAASADGVSGFRERIQRMAVSGFRQRIQRMASADFGRGFRGWRQRILDAASADGRQRISDAD
jgi:hypothetical protein